MPGFPEGPGDCVKFPSVRTLRIAIRSSASDALEASLPHLVLFPHLASLTLRNPVFRAMVELAQALHCLRHLQEVNLIDVLFRAPNFEHHNCYEPVELYKTSLAYPLPPGVIQFRVLGCSRPGYILRWLDEQGPALPPITVLAYECAWGMSGDVDRISRVIDTLGPALRHVILQSADIEVEGVGNPPGGKTAPLRSVLH
ncbi:hypothetical protein BD779DRAFT_1796576 [Infundibulicybe gibba]|nr:hypothetical protein BD779DRAFT_1796576 [Infundibulicybe gibba]